MAENKLKDNVGGEELFQSMQAPSISDYKIAAIQERKPIPETPNFIDALNMPQMALFLVDKKQGEIARSLFSSCEKLSQVIEDLGGQLGPYARNIKFIEKREYLRNFTNQMKATFHTLEALEIPSAAVVGSTLSLIGTFLVSQPISGALILPIVAFGAICSTAIYFGGKTLLSNKSHELYSGDNKDRLATKIAGDLFNSKFVSFEERKFLDLVTARIEQVACMAEIGNSRLGVKTPTKLGIQIQDDTDPDTREEVDLFVRQILIDNDFTDYESVIGNLDWRMASLDEVYSGHSESLISQSEIEELAKLLPPSSELKIKETQSYIARLKNWSESKHCHEQKDEILKNYIYNRFADFFEIVDEQISFDKHQDFLGESVPYRDAESKIISRRPEVSYQEAYSELYDLVLEIEAIKLYLSDQTLEYKAPKHVVHERESTLSSKWMIS